MKYYGVSFKWNSGEIETFCTNLAYAEGEEDVRLHYRKFENVTISEVDANYINSSIKKGMPVIECSKTFNVGGNEYKIIEEWRDGSEKYYLGMAKDEDGIWYHSRVYSTRGEYTGFYSYEHGNDEPSRKTVEDVHENNLAMISLDRREAELDHTDLGDDDGIGI